MVLVLVLGYGCEGGLETYAAVEGGREDRWMDGCGYLWEKGKGKGEEEEEGAGLEVEASPFSFFIAAGEAGFGLIG